MSKNFETERDSALRMTLLRRTDEFAHAAGDVEFGIPDKLWIEFVTFVRELDMEQRTRRLVHAEWNAIKAAQQAECPHERAKIIDNSTGLLRCDNCGATFTYADMEARTPSPKQIEEEKAERLATIAQLAGSPPKS